MDSIGAYEAKTHLPQLLERVVKGERITITRHGIPVAVLTPVTPSSSGSAEESIRSLLEFRRGRKLDGLSVKELIAEGRD